MMDSNDIDLSLGNRVKHAEWKAMEDMSAETAIDDRGCLGEFTDLLKRKLNFEEKFIAQAGGFAFVPGGCIFKIAPRLSLERYDHNRLRISATTCCAGIPSEPSAR